MKCSDVSAWLRRDLDGAVEPSGDVATHLDRCESCRAEAKRLQEVAAAARDALPRAEVPIDFTDATMAALVDGPADQALAAQGRTRFLRWLPVLLALVAVPLLIRLWPSQPDVRELAPFAEASVGGVAVTALSPARLSGTTLQEGDVVLRASEPAVIRTKDAEIRLRADTTCVAMFDGDKDMKATLLTLTVLAGAVTVANAEGEVEVNERAVVRVTKGNPPRVDPEALERELDRIRLHMDVARERLASLRVQLEVATEKRGQARVVNIEKLELERHFASNPDLLLDYGVTELDTAAISRTLRNARAGNVEARRLVNKWMIEVAQRKEAMRYAEQRATMPAPRAEPAEPLEWNELVARARKGDRTARKELERRRVEIDRALQARSVTAEEAAQRLRILLRVEADEIGTLRDLAKAGRPPAEANLEGLRVIRDEAWELRLKLLGTRQRELIDGLETLYVRIEQMAEAAARLRALTLESARLRAAKKLDELERVRRLIEQYRNELANLTAPAPRRNR